MQTEPISKPKLDTKLVSLQVLRSLVKSVPVVGSGLDELLFGTQDRLRSQETDKLVEITQAHLQKEIENLVKIVSTKNDLKASIEQLLKTKDESQKIERTLSEILKNIDAKSPQSKLKDVYYSVEKYFKHLHTETSEDDPLGFSIFSLPISLLPGNLQMDSIDTISTLRSRKIAILGKPASGKSTAVERILNTAINQRDLIPIEIPAADAGELSKVQDRTCAKLGLPVTEKEIFNILEREGRFLYIFDALNEYTNMKELAKAIYDLTNTLISSKFVVTCRTFEYKSEARAELKGFKEFVIRDLDLDVQIAFIRDKVINDSHRDQLLRVFQEDTLLSEVCSNQFIFLMAVTYIPNEKIPPRVSSQFYELFLNHFLKTWEKKSVWRQGSLEEKREFLEEIAVKIAGSKGIMTTIPTTELERIIKQMEVIGSKYSSVLLDELLHHGLLEKKSGHVKFFQETFQEFLLASWLIRKGVFPKELFRSQQGELMYRDLPVSQLSERFYLEMSGIYDLVNQTSNSIEHNFAST